MKIIFDLREKEGSEVYEAIESLYDEPLKLIKLGGKSITPCIGCWDCWLKTPGICVMKDEMVEIYSDYINSDTVILLMDTAQGFINHKAKAFFDRLIPLHHPYIKMLDGECRHVARYKYQPDMVFFYDTNDLTSEEEQVMEDYLYRTAYHFESKPYRIVKDENIKLKLLKARKAKRQAVPFSSAEPMEKLVIYNSSPRRSGSNSTLILSKLVEVLGKRVEVRDLKEKKKWDEWSENFKTENNVMIFMPLYIHAMPSHLMDFIERLEPSRGSISFFIQSGFPESSQSHYLEAYFEQLSIRLGRTYLGTAIKGGVEGLQIKSDKSQEKFIEPIVKAILNLIYQGSFNQDDISQLAIPIQLGKGVEFIFNILAKMGLVHSMWNKPLKENNAFEKRFDRPYLSLNKESSQF